MTILSKTFFTIALVLFAKLGAYQSDFEIDERAKYLVAHVETCLEHAEAGISKLPYEVLQMEGMSSYRLRHLLNNLCTLPDTRYLEIGIWKGSTFVSALYGNNDTLEDAVGIDNWSQWGGPLQIFKENCQTFLQGVDYRFFSADCFSINLEKTFSESVNIYLYDGLHTKQAQELALTYYDSVLADIFILIVDDWFDFQVMKGTKIAIEKLKYEILYSKELPKKYIGDNNIFIAVMRKPKS